MENNGFEFISTCQTQEPQIKLVGAFFSLFTKLMPQLFL